ncbi:MAG: hypothetical protein JSW73_04170 [Candidatus Woesearchaeota archaeon]|nr:MAG: hypothetical protein JSW73_04170 [Candidatus Woesearchaeota archaeon]
MNNIKSLTTDEIWKKYQEDRDLKLYVLYSQHLGYPKAIKHNFLLAGLIKEFDKMHEVINLDPYVGLNVNLSKTEPYGLWGTCSSAYTYQILDLNSDDIVSIIDNYEIHEEQAKSAVKEICKKETKGLEVYLQKVKMYVKNFPIQNKLRVNL